jgi:PKD repeat protein
VDGVSIGHPDSYNFVNVLADHTLQVLFVAPLTLACSADPPSGIAPLAVSFTATPAGGNSAAYTYAWDFGDGAISTAKNPNHTYAAAGVYTVTVTVADGLQTAPCETTVTVGVNHDPTVDNLQADPAVASLGVPSAITFTLDDVDPGDGISWTAILTQTPVSIGMLDVTSGGPVPSGTGVTLHYTVLQACPGARAACEATVEITATDAHGGTSSQSVAISIQ